jgi:hypothetical protein
MNIDAKIEHSSTCSTSKQRNFAADQVIRADSSTQTRMKKAFDEATLIASDIPKQFDTLLNSAKHREPLIFKRTQSSYVNV